MNERQHTNTETPKMAISKMYEVNVTVKVVIHAFDAVEAARLASRNLELQGWAVRSANDAKRINV